MHQLIIGTEPEYLLNFRGDLIRALSARSHRVTAIIASATASQRTEIASLGAELRIVPIQRNGLSPIADIRTLLALRRAIKELQPDAVLAYTVKPVIWGALALPRSQRPRFVALITGLGFALHGRGMLRSWLTQLVSLLYRVAMARVDAVVFQNAENQAAFIRLAALPRAKAHVVPGSGVDLDRFASRPLPPGPSRFLLIARLLKEKGLRDYAAAARRVKLRHPEATFQLLGRPDRSPDGVPLAEVQSWHEEGVVQYLGEATDVRPHIAACHIYVLPSYHEGMPRSTLEAMAIGRPILTTDVPGCRDTVIPGDNGFVVPHGDVDALVERMVWFIENRAEWERMGRASRVLATKRFDVKLVNRQLMEILRA